MHLKISTTSAVKNSLGHKSRLLGDISSSPPPQAGAILRSMHNYTCWFPGLRWWMCWKWGWRESKVAIKSNQWAEKAQGSRENGAINHVRHACLIPYQHPEEWRVKSCGIITETDTESGNGTNTVRGKRWSDSWVWDRMRLLQKNTHSDGSSMWIEQLLSLHTFSPDFCFLNLMSEIFIAARLDSSLRPLCKGYLLAVPCSRWPDRNPIHLKSLILSCCDPSAITCLGGPDVLDAGTVRLFWAPSHLVPLHFPKAEFHFVLPSGDI